MQILSGKNAKSTKSLLAKQKLFSSSDIPALLTNPSQADVLANALTEQLKPIETIASDTYVPTAADTVETTHSLIEPTKPVYYAEVSPATLTGETLVDAPIVDAPIPAVSAAPVAATGVASVPAAVAGLDLSTVLLGLAGLGGVAIAAGGGGAAPAVLADTVAPVIVSMKAAGSQVVLTYSEALNATKLPAVGDFVVTVGGGADVVTAVSVTGNTMTLTLATPVAIGAAVTVDYTPGQSH